MSQDRTTTPAKASRPGDNVNQVDELLRRTTAPATTPTRLIAAGIKHGRGPYTLRTAVNV